jgi:hypothetical protein
VTLSEIVEGHPRLVLALGIGPDLADRRAVVSLKKRQTAQKLGKTGDK